MKRLDAKPRELGVTFYQGKGTPCPCAADGVSLAVYASPGQGTLHIATDKSPLGTFAMVIIRPRKGGDGLKYAVPIAFMPKLGQINSTVQDPVGPVQSRYGPSGPVHSRASQVTATVTHTPRQSALSGIYRSG